MELRRFNASGLSAFSAFLDSCNTDTPLPWPESALTDPEHSHPVEPTIQLLRRPFASRFELAEYLVARFEAAGFRPSTRDGELWAWIACCYFNEICPTNKAGKFEPGSLPRWIPRSADFRRYYRHLVAGPYLIYTAHRDNPRRALALLCQKPGRPGDIVEQLASRQQIVTNPAIMQIATDWFVDPATGKQRSGANSKGRGGPRRLISLMDQFDLTWDLSMVSPEELASLLPDEFRPGT